jgi:hypothetical protein
LRKIGQWVRNAWVGGSNPSIGTIKSIIHSRFGKLDCPIKSQLSNKKHTYDGELYIDEVFVKINGEQQYLWRAVDQDGEVVDVLRTALKDSGARNAGGAVSFGCCVDPLRPPPKADRRNCSFSLI